MVAAIKEASMDDIGEVRAFSRLYTRVIGALDAGHLDTRFTLSEARLIYEVATHGETTAAEIASAMGVDPAYVSRLVGRLKDDGILELKANDRDRRQSDIALSSGGQAAFAQLD